MSRRLLKVYSRLALEVFEPRGIGKPEQVANAENSLTEAEGIRRVDIASDHVVVQNGRVFCVLTKFRKIAAQDALVEKIVTGSGFRVRRIIAQATQKQLLRVRPFGEKIRSNVLPFFLVVFAALLRSARQFANSEADATTLHHS